MKLSEKVRDQFEEYLERSLNGHVDVYEEDDRIIFECSGCSNPAGEDWLVAFYVDMVFDDSSEYDIFNLEEISRNHVIYALEDTWQGFDIDDEVRIWADTAGNGKTPGFATLIKNAEFKKSKLELLFYNYRNNDPNWSSAY